MFWYVSFLPFLAASRNNRKIGFAAFSIGFLQYFCFAKNRQRSGTYGTLYNGVKEKERSYGDVLSLTPPEAPCVCVLLLIRLLHESYERVHYPSKNA